MEIRILGHHTIEGVYHFEKTMTLKDIYEAVGGINKPKVIQVGGALGELIKDYDILRTLDSFEASLYEPTISFFDSKLCSVDFMRFMLRFIMRELNIISDDIKMMYDVIVKMTEGHANSEDKGKLLKCLENKSKTNGERLLKKNILTLYQYFSDEFDEHVSGYCQNSICRGLFDAQCINACPAHIHIPGFVAHMKAGDTTKAYQLMRQENPLSSVCGSVCARPCELRCRRGEITTTVGVRALQRFISIDALNRNALNEFCLPENGKNIGIIGGGPSGLTAAYFLKRSGYAVTIYEKESYAGGMLSFGVPSYRLPLNAIQDEIKTIVDLGVKIVFNHEISKEAFETLKNEHDVLVMATGATLGNQLDIDFDHLVTGIDFLKSVRKTSVKEIGKRVLVVGGGDVALDCARTAKRLGADVYVLTLESFEQMPASKEEKLSSIEENINFLCGYGIGSTSGNHLILKKCTQVFDVGGVFSPLFSSKEKILEDVDTIISCIGQHPNTNYLNGMYTHKNGFVKPKQGYKIEENLYCCGDVIKPTIVIDAIAQGKKVAAQIHADFGGKGLFVGEPIPIPEQLLNIRTFDCDLREEKQIGKNRRLTSFDEVTEVYTLEDAIYESARCMRCDQNSKKSLLLGR